MERAYRAIERVSDTGAFRPRTDELLTDDPLEWPDYRSQVERAKQRSGVDESVVAGGTTIGSIAVEIAAFDFAFIGGSMGEVAGERIARGLDAAADRGVPFVILTATGGARMQEGMRALAQMPKLIAARLALADAHQPLVALLGHPTTGGVLASIGGSADVTAALGSGATIGFAGPRIVSRHTGAPLTPGSHTAASAFANGMVDATVSEGDERRWLIDVLDVLSAVHGPPVEEPSAPIRDPHPDAWASVEATRSATRPRAHRLVAEMSERFVELHGDRAGRDDLALAAFLCRIEGRRAVVLALDRDRFPGVGAYRKARRAMAIAERLRIPVVSLIDTRGADPSEPSEAAGIAWEISATFAAVLALEVPLLAIVTGEGVSGGALALAAGDTLLMHEDSIFSVIGPEAAAEILWRDGSRGPDAARLLKLTAHDLVALGIADWVIGGALSGGALAVTVAYHLDLLRAQGPDGPERARARQRRWRSRGGP